MYMCLVIWELEVGAWWVSYIKGEVFQNQWN